jgi:hypothetical protein
MAVATKDIKKAVTPLKFVFWGALVCLVDFTSSSRVNGEGWSFDILNDAAGAVLIAWGVWKLMNIPVNPSYDGWMTFVEVVAVLTVIEAVQAHYAGPRPEIMQTLLMILGLAQLVAIIAFCLCMRMLCIEGNLAKSVRSWRLTTILFAVIYFLPLGLFYAAHLFAIVTSSPSLSIFRQPPFYY